MKTICVQEDGSDRLTVIPTANIDYLRDAGEGFSQITLKSGVKIETANCVFCVMEFMEG